MHPSIHHSHTSDAASAAAMGGILRSLSRSWRAVRSLFRSRAPRRALSVLGGHIHAMGPILSAAGTCRRRGGCAGHKWADLALSRDQNLPLKAVERVWDSKDRNLVRISACPDVQTTSLYSCILVWLSTHGSLSFSFFEFSV